MSTIAHSAPRSRRRVWHYGQCGRLRRVLLWSYSAVAASLLLPLLAKVRWGIPSEHFLRDMATITGVPAYVGLFSNVGILLWAAAATLCFFVALLSPHSSGQRVAFWTYAGLLTSALLLDDLFLFHEVLFPYHLGLPEPLVYVTYGVAAGAFLLLFRRTILATDYALLALALVWFGASLVVDRWGHLWLPRGFFLVEDGFKMLGIVSWFLYFARTATRETRTLLAAR